MRGYMALSASRGQAKAEPPVRPTFAMFAQHADYYRQEMRQQRQAVKQQQSQQQRQDEIHDMYEERLREMERESLYWQEAGIKYKVLCEKLRAMTAYGGTLPQELMDTHMHHLAAKYQLPSPNMTTTNKKTPNVPPTAAFSVPCPVDTSELANTLNKLAHKDQPVLHGEASGCDAEYGTSRPATDIKGAPMGTVASLTAKYDGARLFAPSRAAGVRSKCVLKPATLQGATAPSSYVNPMPASNKRVLEYTVKGTQTYLREQHDGGVQTIYTPPTQAIYRGERYGHNYYNVSKEANVHGALAPTHPALLASMRSSRNYGGACRATQGMQTEGAIVEGTMRDRISVRSYYLAEANPTSTPETNWHELMMLKCRDPHGETAAPIGAHAPPAMPTSSHLMQQHFRHPPTIAASGALAPHAPGWGFISPAAAMAPQRAPQTAAAPQRHAVAVRPNIAAIPRATPAASNAREGERRVEERREREEERERDEEERDEETAAGQQAEDAHTHRHTPTAAAEGKERAEGDHSQQQQLLPTFYVPRLLSIHLAAHPQRRFCREDFREARWPDTPLLCAESIDSQADEILHTPRRPPPSHRPQPAPSTAGVPPSPHRLPATTTTRHKPTRPLSAPSTPPSAPAADHRAPGAVSGSSRCQEGRQGALQKGLPRRRNRPTSASTRSCSGPSPTAPPSVPTGPTISCSSIRLADAGDVASGRWPHLRKMCAIPTHTDGTDVPEAASCCRIPVIRKRVKEDRRWLFQDRYEMVVHNIMTHLAISRLAQPPSPSDPPTIADEQQQQHAPAGVMSDPIAHFYRELVASSNYGWCGLAATGNPFFADIAKEKGDDPLGHRSSKTEAKSPRWCGAPFFATPFLACGNGQRLGENETTTAIKVCEADEVLPPDDARIMTVPLYPPGPPTSCNSVLPLPEQRKPLLMQQHGLHTEEDWAAWRAEKATKSGLDLDDTGEVCRSLQTLGVEGVEQEVARVVMVKDMFDKYMMMRETVVPVLDSEYDSALSSATAEEDILAAGMKRARGESSGRTFVWGDLTPSNALVAISRYELQLKAGGTGRFVLPSVVFIDPSGTSRGTISALSGKTSYETMENKLLAELREKLPEGVDWGDVAGSLLDYGWADEEEGVESGGADGGEDFWSATKSAMEALHPPGVYVSRHLPPPPGIDVDKAAFLYARTFERRDRFPQQEKHLERMEELGKTAAYERIYTEELFKAKWPDTLLLCAEGIDSQAACHAKADEILGTLRDRHVPASLVDPVDQWRKEGVQLERLVGMVNEKDISLLEAATAIIYTHTSARADERGEKGRLPLISDQLGQLLQGCDAVPFILPPCPTPSPSPAPSSRV
ncbi:unnamed protein product [Vitrella brassicaformis CCMP3155]|uniref:Uncharacterized protein n=1 Tax=Vitrella brassicaformis (strain CCMP3155) TaxID=1169540 RepID=A0A0G4H067_VITBC|nr:unnamed protein product [Vitrella brassicaformis CCMP3155]|eukprot:CEM36940.1 unnamed protein product [Vitrella brassicaformis CCMP3155]